MLKRLWRLVSHVLDTWVVWLAGPPPVHPAEKPWRRPIPSELEAKYSHLEWWPRYKKLYEHTTPEEWDEIWHKVSLDLKHAIKQVEHTAAATFATSQDHPFDPDIFNASTLHRPRRRTHRRQR